MIGEDLQKFSESRVMRTIAIGRVPIRNLPNFGPSKEMPANLLNNANWNPGFDFLLCQEDVSLHSVATISPEITDLQPTGIEAKNYWMSITLHSISTVQIFLKNGQICLPTQGRPEGGANVAAALGPAQLTVFAN
ncbi:hypothetical protein AVEN_121549-1 [Araneus ventricosus]|uniref:Uncharacterized protein n=1 Tax=Araneus ventricosus TaxID=182803 RepID=A0A4Y2GRB0_ARAVE|nr:hypothetical protein AVEN_121549-1 [Araneus ventricosus]